MTPGPAPAAPPRAAAPTEFAHVDDHCIVALKPAGLLSVPGRQTQDCLSERVRAHFPDALVVHRLDMATSGLMLLARGASAQRALSAAFAQRRVHKTYTALVDGWVLADAGEIDLPLSADWPHRPRQRVDPEHGKPSLTRYRVVQRHADPRCTRLALEPVTGRAHQLRVHLLALGHPIRGDALYAPDVPTAGAGRLALHASALRFAHPVSGCSVALESAAPF